MVNVIIPERGADLALATAGAIVTHVSPDWDALTSAWFMWQLGGKSERVVLVPAGTPADAMPNAKAIVDVGDVYNASNWRLDHHQNPDNRTSATHMAYTLAVEVCGRVNLMPMLDFVLTVTAADLGQSSHGAKESRQSGLHALLSSWKFQRVPDTEIFSRSFTLLDRICAGADPRHLPAEWPEDMASFAQAQQNARGEYQRGLVYRSADGLVVALMDASPLASQIAYEEGVILVVFHNSQTLASGISRKGEQVQPHVGKIVEKILALDPMMFDHLYGVQSEMVDWFRHPAGFFSGLSPKAGEITRPLRAPLAEIAAAVDAAWTR